VERIEREGDIRREQEREGEMGERGGGGGEGGFKKIKLKL